MVKMCLKKQKGKHMKKTLSVLSALALGACVYGTPVNNEGFYSDMNLADVDWTAINKSGYSCQTNWFGIIPVGDNSLPAAIKSARIQKLAYVDTDYALYFPLASRECTNVWGTGYSTPILTLPEPVEPVATKAPAKATKAAAKTETKAAPKAETKAETKAEAKVEAKAETPAAKTTEKK